MTEEQFYDFLYDYQDNVGFWTLPVVDYVKDFFERADRIGGESRTTSYFYTDSTWDDCLVCIIGWEPIISKHLIYIKNLHREGEERVFKYVYLDGSWEDCTE